MTSLERDYKKLKKLANTLGLKVYTRKYTRYTGIAEYVENEYITIFDKRTSKTDKVLSLMHELGHHFDFIRNGSTKKEDKAIIKLNDGPMVGERPDLTKEERRLILQVEKKGVVYMPEIHNMLSLEIPIIKVIKQQYNDLFDYEFLYRKGRFPTLEECKLNERKNRRIKKRIR